MTRDSANGGPGKARDSTAGQGAAARRAALSENAEDAEGATLVSMHIAKASRLPMRECESLVAEAGRGLVGDRYHGTRHRHVTVQSLEELALAAEKHGASIDPNLTRRNLTISRGIVPRKPGTRWCVGSVLLEVVRDAAPCKLLEDTLGRDARLALSRKAGVVCRVLEGGTLRIGDRVSFGASPESREGP